MRTQYRKKCCLVLLVALLASLSITSCTGSTKKEKPLEISKINAVDYPNRVGSFFHLDDSFKELFNQNIHNKPLKVINDNEFVDEYMYFPLSKHDDLMDALAYQEQVSMYVTKHFKKGKKRVRRKGHATTIR